MAEKNLISETVTCASNIFVMTAIIIRGIIIGAKALDINRIIDTTMETEITNKSKDTIILWIMVTLFFRTKKRILEAIFEGQGI